MAEVSKRKYSEDCEYEYETTLHRRKCGLDRDHTCHHGGIKSSWPPQPPPHSYVAPKATVPREGDKNG